MMLGISLLIFGTVFLFDGMIMVKSWNQERRQNIAASEKMVGKIQHATKSFIEQMDRILSSIYYEMYSDPDGEFYKLLSGTPYSTNMERVQVKRYIDNYFSSVYLVQNELVSVYIYVDDGKDYYYSNYGSLIRGYSPVDSEWYKETIRRDGKTYARLNYRPEGTTCRKQVIGFSRKLKDVMGNRISDDAVILLEFSVSMMENIVDSYIADANSEVCFLNEEGDVIYCLGQDYVLERIDPEKFDIERKHSEIARIDDRLFLLSMGGKRIQDWYLAVLTDYAYLFESFRHYLTVSILLALLIIMLAIVLVSIYVKKICREINALEEGMTRLCSGDFTIQLETQRKDEIGSLVCSFNTMVNRTSDLVHRQYEQELEKRDAQYKYLQAQINPHFIFNSLQVISSMAIVKGAPDIETVSNALARLLAYSVDTQEKDILIEEELKNNDRYMLIQQIRFRDRLTYSVDVEEKLYRLRIIPMVLQPIVENAISHGFNPRGGKGRISIRGWCEETDCLLEIKDDGVGMTNDYLDQLTHYINDDAQVQIQVDGHGVGLRNINRRLKLYYGKEYGLIIRSTVDEGTSVSIRIPAGRREDGNDKIDDC